MTVLQLGVLALIALAAPAVAGARDPSHQAVVLGVIGLLLAVFFVLLDAPEVALSQIVVGSVLVPLMMLLALAKARAYARRGEGD